MGEVVGSKLEEVVELYRRTTADNGYDPWLSYRVILLCLTNNHSSHFNPAEEVHRFFKQCLGVGSL